MSNKQRLQVNNTNLSTVLSEIGDLPLKALVEAAAREGQYVWKKTSRISLVLTSTGVNPSILQCSSDSVDLSKLTVEDFYGYSGEAVATSGNIGWILNFSFSAQGFTYNNSGKYSTISYDASKAQIKLGESFSNMYAFPDYEIEEPTYVVDNDPNKYPDGGMQDGCWYERMTEPIELGYDNVDTGKVVLTGDSYNLSVNHGLGVVPDLFIIYTPYNFLTETEYSLFGLKAAVITSKSNNRAAGIMKYNANNLTYESCSNFNSSLSVSASSVNMKFSSNTRVCGFRGGIPYYWIALA